MTTTDTVYNKAMATEFSINIKYIDGVNKQLHAVGMRQLFNWADNAVNHELDVAEVTEYELVDGEFVLIQKTEVSALVNQAKHNAAKS